MHTLTSEPNRSEPRAQKKDEAAGAERLLALPGWDSTIAPFLLKSTRPRWRLFGMEFGKKPAFVRAMLSGKPQDW